MNYKTKKFKKGIPFITASKRMKNLGINSTNKESTLKTMTLMKETEDTNKKKAKAVFLRFPKVRKEKKFTAVT